MWSRRRVRFWSIKDSCSPGSKPLHSCSTSSFADPCAFRCRDFLVGGQSYSLLLGAMRGDAGDLASGQPANGKRELRMCSITQAAYATATVDAWYTSVGIDWRSRQVIAIGRSPSCETYSAGPRNT